MSYSIIVQFFLILLVLLFAIFTCYEFFSSKSRRNKIFKDSEFEKSLACDIFSVDSISAITRDSQFRATCSILLPVCNELAVIEQLLIAVCDIEVPQNCEVEILLLDDSSDDNSKIVKEIFDRFLLTVRIKSGDKQHSGFDKSDTCSATCGDHKTVALPISSTVGTSGALAPNAASVCENFQTPSIAYHRRSEYERKGFKAGNISYGLTFAKGDFIVIFDADSIPPKDFLIKTMPYFKDDRVGLLQTVIEFRNRRQNFITRFLALETSHKDDITSYQSRNNHSDAKNNTSEENSIADSVRQDFASLTGSSCIWRRACIDEIGGFSAATLTEDIDLCYRAQISGWKYVYAESVITTEELPCSVSGLRIQRHRWAYGLIRNAFLHTSKILHARGFSFAKKFKAFMLIFQTFLLASFIILLILSLPLVFSTNELGITFNITCSIFLLTAIVWGANNLSTGKNRIEQRNFSPCNGMHEKDSIHVSQDENYVRKLNINNKNDCHTPYYEYISYILMYLPLSLYYFVALVENILGIKASFIPTEKNGLFKDDAKIFNNASMSKIQLCMPSDKNNSATHTLDLDASKGLGSVDRAEAKNGSASKVKNSKLNKLLFIFEVISFLYAFIVCSLSICFENWWTMLYGSICLCGFSLVIFLTVVENYKNSRG